MRRRTTLALVALAMGCGGSEDGTGAPAGSTDGADCSQEPECPVGTALVTNASSSGGYDVSGGYDPDRFDPTSAYAPIGDARCDFGCEPITECPDGTFPVIHEDCFSCGVIETDGNVIDPCAGA